MRYIILSWHIYKDWKISLIIYRFHNNSLANCYGIDSKTANYVVPKSISNQSGLICQQFDTTFGSIVECQRGLCRSVISTHSMFWQFNFRPAPNLHYLFFAGLSHSISFVLRKMENWSVKILCTTTNQPGSQITPSAS